MPLALYTFGIFTERAGAPSNAGFHTLNDPVLASVDQAQGFIARSGYASDPPPAPASWGPETYPRFYEERGDGWSPATLSLWTDLESVFHFTYSGLHAAALRRGREWFVKPAWPPLVLWWHQGETPPTWSEAVHRHEHMHDFGPSPKGFTFKQPFDAAGLPTKLDQTRLDRLRAS